MNTIPPLYPLTWNTSSIDISGLFATKQLFTTYINASNSQLNAAIIIGRYGMMALGTATDNSSGNEVAMAGIPMAPFNVNIHPGVNYTLFTK